MMSRTSMSFTQIRSLTQLRNLLSEILDLISKTGSKPASSPSHKQDRPDVNNEHVRVDSVKQLARLVSKSLGTTVHRTASYVISEKVVTYSADKEMKQELPPRVNQPVKEFVKVQDNELERALLDWAESGQMPAVKKTTSSNKIKHQSLPEPLGRVPLNVENRSRFLVRSLVTATSTESQLLRLDDLCKHLLNHPAAKSIAIKENALKYVLNLREKCTDEEVRSLAREVLTLLGFSDPPQGSGIRILSIDGGGTRGIMAIEIIRQLEKLTGRRVHELFDFICGVSTGAILAILFGGMQMGLDECEQLYRHMSGHVFNQNALLGTSRLVWSHAYYDTSVWEKILRETYGEGGLTEVARRKGNPKIATVSAIMNQPLLNAYMFRSYSLPYRSPSNYMGGCNHKSWEAIRASAAAPGYFEEYCIGGLAHQDGGLMWNNPTALAIHEAQLLWPREHLACVVSLGTGRYVPATPKVSTTSVSLKTKMLKILDSATDTEGVHLMLHDLLPPSVYFRLNPYLTEPIMMDENRPEKLQQLKLDAQLYLRKNGHKLQRAAETLTKKRSRLQKVQDWLSLQAALRIG